MTTYKSVGVDIVAADELVNDSIKQFAKMTYKSGVMAGVGGFGSVFDIASLQMKDPLLITTTDGVGTKLLLAIEANNYKNIGQDLVAMCVNDLVATGAKPQLFLDYYATGKLDKDVAGKIIKSIAYACMVANCSLVGGETAEMPGLYKSGDLDLAGFAVGFVERNNLLPKILSDGDTIIGLPSNGIHSNGFSLVREILKNEKIKLTDPAPWDPSIGVASSLLEPTEIYVNRVLGYQNSGTLKAAAHITGGGLATNLERVIDDNHQAIIERNINHWYMPPVFGWLSQFVDIDEMYKVFNCGIGMIVIVDDIEKASTLFNGGETIIGMIKDRTIEPKVSLLNTYMDCMLNDIHKRSTK